MRLFSVILVSMLLLSTSVHARSPGASDSLMDVPLSFWAYVDQVQSDWDIGGVNADTEVLHVGAGFAQHFSKRFHAGLFGGLSRVTQNNYARTAGITQSGGYVGMIVRTYPMRSKKFDIDAGATLAYNMVDGDAAGRTVESSWLEGVAYLKGIVKLDAVRFSVGGQYQYIDGTEKYNSATLSQNTDIKAQDDVSGTAGIDVLVDGGSIGLHGEWGARSTISLQFARDF